MNGPKDLQADLEQLQQKYDSAPTIGEQAMLLEKLRTTRAQLDGLSENSHE